MTERTLECIMDFGSPNAYFVYKALPPVLARTKATIKYTPCLLGGIFKATNNQSPVMAFSGVKGKLAYEQLEMERFRNKHGITDFTFNPHFPINTLIMMRGAMAAEADGRLDDYLDAGFHHMWVEPKKMDDPTVFSEAMTSSGFDGAALLERTQAPEVKQKLIENTNAAVERGVFGIPTFFIGEEMFFGKDRLIQIEETLNAL